MESTPQPTERVIQNKGIWTLHVYKHTGAVLHLKNDITAMNWIKSVENTGQFAFAHWSLRSDDKSTRPLLYFSPPEPFHKGHRPDKPGVSPAMTLVIGTDISNYPQDSGELKIALTDLNALCGPLNLVPREGIIIPHKGGHVGLSDYNCAQTFATTFQKIFTSCNLPPPILKDAEIAPQIQDIVKRGFNRFFKETEERTIQISLKTSSSKPTDEEKKSESVPPPRSFVDKQQPSTQPAPKDRPVRVKRDPSTRTKAEQHTLVPGREIIYVSTEEYAKLTQFDSRDSNKKGDTYEMRQGRIVHEMVDFYLTGKYPYLPTDMPFDNLASFLGGLLIDTMRAGYQEGAHNPFIQGNGILVQVSLEGGRSACSLLLESGRQLKPEQMDDPVIGTRIVADESSARFAGIPDGWMTASTRQLTIWDMKCTNDDRSTFGLTKSIGYAHAIQPSRSIIPVVHWQPLRNIILCVAEESSDERLAQQASNNPLFHTLYKCVQRAPTLEEVKKLLSEQLGSGAWNIKIPENGLYKVYPTALYVVGGYLTNHYTGDPQAVNYLDYWTSSPYLPTTVLQGPLIFLILLLCGLTYRSNIHKEAVRLQYTGGPELNELRQWVIEEFKKKYSLEEYRANLKRSEDLKRLDEQEQAQKKHYRQRW